MQSIIEDIERRYPRANVIIACSSGDDSETLLKLLSDRGFNPVGIADRASVALALASQIPADVAVVQAELSGRRSGRDLAVELHGTWGLPTFVFGETPPTEPDVAPAEGRSAQDGPSTEQGGRPEQRASRLR